MVSVSGSWHGHDAGFPRGTRPLTSGPWGTQPSRVSMTAGVQPTGPFRGVVLPVRTQTLPKTASEPIVSHPVQDKGVLAIQVFDEEVGQLARKTEELERSVRDLRPVISLDRDQSRSALCQRWQQLDDFRPEMLRLGQDARTAMSEVEQVRSSFERCHMTCTRCSCNRIVSLDPKDVEISAVKQESKMQGTEDVLDTFADRQMSNVRETEGWTDSAETTLASEAAYLQKLEESLTPFGTRLECVEQSQACFGELQTRLEELGELVSNLHPLCFEGQRCNSELEGRVEMLETLVLSSDFSQHSELREALSSLEQGLPQIICDELQKRVLCLEERLPQMLSTSLDERLSCGRDDGERAILEARLSWLERCAEIGLDEVTACFTSLEQRFQNSCGCGVDSQSSSCEVAMRLSSLEERFSPSAVDEVQARLEFLEHHAVLFQPEEFRERLRNMEEHLEDVLCETDQLRETVRQLGVVTCEAGARRLSSSSVQACRGPAMYDADLEVDNIIARTMERPASGSVSSCESIELHSGTSVASADSPRPCAPNPSGPASCLVDTRNALDDMNSACARVAVPWTLVPPSPKRPGGTDEFVRGAARGVQHRQRALLSTCEEVTEVSEDDRGEDWI